MLQDIKNACRSLLKTPWFACVVVLIALGIGASTAIFGVVNKLLLNPWPYADSDRIVRLDIARPREQYAISTPLTAANAWREQARSFEGIEGVGFGGDVLAHDESGARVLRGMRFTPGLPAFLGVAPLLGRGFTLDDAEAGAPAVVILSYEMWQRDYGGAADVIGRAITLDEVAHVVVGVMPPRWDAFAFNFRAEVWFPQAFVVASDSPNNTLGGVLGRLRPGVSLDSATNELAAILARVDPATLWFGTEPVIVRLQRPADAIAGGTRDALFVLLGAVALVLLVACSNVANLLLARGASRARELSLRAALGASTWRLVRALFAECVVLALAAGVAGLGVGWLTLRILVPLRPASLSTFGEAQLDTTVLAFTLGLSVATACLFGLAPALQLASRRLGGALRHGASGVVRGGMGPRLRKLLVAAQTALSVVLLVSAGLLIRSFIHLQNVELGYDIEGLFSAELSLPPSKYETQSRDVLVEQLLDRIRSSPGVAAVTEVFFPPPLTMGFNFGTDMIRGGAPSEGEARPGWSNAVPPDYFSVLRIPLIEGRTFTADEMRSGNAVIVNRAAAQHLWPNGGALGAEVKWGTWDWMTVVGVADNVVAGGLTRSRDRPGIYYPLRGMAATSPLRLVVRSAADPAIAIASVRGAVRALDPEIAVANVALFETTLASTIDAPRFNMALLTAFAVIGLVLAAVGLAAVIGYEVTERTHEIGIRMALGARTENVRRFALWHGLTPAFAGVVIGMIGAFAATQLVTSMLYGITPHDPLTFVGVITLLVLVALGASWLPARRATRVDPITALRAE
jgi:putative ABC transport system permease protein